MKYLKPYNEAVGDSNFKTVKDFTTNLILLLEDNNYFEVGEIASNIRLVDDQHFVDMLAHKKLKSYNTMPHDLLIPDVNRRLKCYETSVWCTDIEVTGLKFKITENFEKYDNTEFKQAMNDVNIMYSRVSAGEIPHDHVKEYKDILKYKMIDVNKKVFGNIGRKLDFEVKNVEAIDLSLNDLKSLEVQITIRWI